MILNLPHPISTNRYWRSVMVNGRVRLLVSREARAYKVEVSWLASIAKVKPLACAVQVSIQYTPRNRGRIDLDNCLKIVLDSLNGIAYNDDRQIHRLSIELMPPTKDGGLRVTVLPLD